MSVSTRTRQLVAEARLRELNKKPFFSICTVNEACAALGIHDYRSNPAYDVLHALHCVHYRDMSRELIQEIPKLIAAVLNVEHIDVVPSGVRTQRAQPLDPAVVDVTPKKRSLLSFFTGKKP